MAFHWHDTTFLSSLIAPSVAILAIIDQRNSTIGFDSLIISHIYTSQHMALSPVYINFR